MEKPAARVYTIPDVLKLKLRQQAAKRGLTPGSARWRAYVLGTEAAMRRKKKARKAGDKMSPVCPSELVDNRPKNEKTN